MPKFSKLFSSTDPFPLGTGFCFEILNLKEEPNQNQIKNLSDLFWIFMHWESISQDGYRVYENVLYSLRKQRSSDPRSRPRQCRKDHNPLWVSLISRLPISCFSILSNGSLSNFDNSMVFAFVFCADRLQMGEVVSTIPSWCSFPFLKFWVYSLLILFLSMLECFQT